MEVNVKELSDKSFAKFEAIRYKSQVVAGTNYKIEVGCLNINVFV